MLEPPIRREVASTVTFVREVAVALLILAEGSQLLMENRFVPPDDIAFLFAQGVDFVPEAGQSISTAHMRAIDRLADEMEKYVAENEKLLGEYFARPRPPTNRQKAPPQEGPPAAGGKANLGNADGRR